MKKPRLHADAASGNHKQVVPREGDLTQPGAILVLRMLRVWRQECHSAVKFPVLSSI